VVLGQIEGATIELALDAIAQRIRRETLALADVRQVSPTIIPRRNGVDVRVVVQTSPDIDVPAKAAEVGTVVRQAMEQRMGLRVGQVWVNIRHEAHGASAGASAAH
jgi:uncharacterized alkaline shock family protein YloU